MANAQSAFQVQYQGEKRRKVAKSWISGAIRHPGALRRSAEAAGMSTQAFAQKHKHDATKTGNRARLALTLGKMRKKKK